MRDLPPIEARRDPLFELVCRVAGQRKRFAIGEGESIVGSSPRADISIRVAGVRVRHLRLKRNGERIYLEPIGGASVVSGGRLVEGLVSLAVGQPFTFGSVTAQVERLMPADRHNAVPIPTTQIAISTEEADAWDSPSRQLGRLNELVEASLSAPIRPEAILETLTQCLAPTAAAIFRQRRDGEWTRLAEVASPGGPSIESPDAPAGCRRYRARVEEDTLLLVVLPASDTGQPWQDELCRLLALLSAAWVPHRRGAARPAASPGQDPVWDALVGSRIRRELAGCVDACRYSDTVLVVGATGTGKELVARALHGLWERKGEFVALNCGAIPGDLLDAELFGIETGTATGVEGRRGRLEQAEQGTLFLDEIAELPMHLQSKLLRVVQERDYYTVGGRKLRRADVKIVTATNQPVERLRAGLLRQDLYFRLAQSTIALPPLQQRREDLAALCEHFLTQLERQFGRGVIGVSGAALDRLKAYAWPGNVRELQSVLRAAYAAAQRGELIQSVHLPESLNGTSAAPLNGELAAIRGQLQKDVIQRALKANRRVSDAAGELGLSPGYLYRLMKRLGIEHPERPSIHLGSRPARRDRATTRKERESS